MLLEQFGDEYLEEQDEVEFLISEGESRTLAEIIEAEQEFFDKVRYVRSIACDDKRELPGDIRTGIMANRERVEAEYGRDGLWRAIASGHEEASQYGYISGNWRHSDESSVPQAGLPRHLASIHRVNLNDWFPFAGLES